MIYKRRESLYDCIEAKYRISIIVNNVIKWAQAGDFLCYPLDKDGKRIERPFICQPKEFFQTFVLEAEANGNG